MLSAFYQNRLQILCADVKIEHLNFTNVFFIELSWTKSKILNQFFRKNSIPFRLEPSAICFIECSLFLGQIKGKMCFQRIIDVVFIASPFLLAILFENLAFSDEEECKVVWFPTRMIIILKLCCDYQKIYNYRLFRLLAKVTTMDQTIVWRLGTPTRMSLSNVASE